MFKGSRHSICSWRSAIQISEDLIDTQCVWVVYPGFTDDHPKNLGMKANQRVPRHQKTEKKKKDSSYVSLDHCYILLCSKYLFCSYRKRQILFLQSSGILVHRFFEQHGCPSNPSFTHLKQNFCKYSIKS